MEEYIRNLKQTKGYDDQTLNIIFNIMKAFNEVLGDENMPKVFQAINNVQIFLYDNPMQASTILSQYFNNGKEYRIGAQATGSGFTEDEYFLTESGELKQQLVIGLDKNNIKIQTLVHELCHAIAYINGCSVKDNILYTNTGFDFVTYDFSNGMKGEKINSRGTFFNEIVTENLAMQVMDVYDKTISHEATAYNGYASNFKNFFRSECLNKILIESYINHDNNFIKKLDEIVDQQIYLDSVYSTYNFIDNNNFTIRNYLDQLSKMTFSEFFDLYSTYMNKMLGTLKLNGTNENDFKMMKKINQHIIYTVGNVIKTKELDSLSNDVHRH